MSEDIIVYGEGNALELTIPPGAFTAGDVLFGTVDVPAAFRIPGNGIYVHSATLFDPEGKKVPVDVFLSVGLAGEDVRGVLSFCDFVDMGSAALSEITNAGKRIQAKDGSSTLYLSAYVRGDVTYTEPLTLVINIARD